MHWPEFPLNDCCFYIQRGKSPKYSDSGRVKIINQKCIRWTAFELEWAKNWDNTAIGSLDKTRYVVKGDILINSTGEGTIGRANVWESPDSNWVVDSHVTIVRPNPRILDSWWLKYWLESPIGQEFVLQSKVGGTKQTELGANKIKATKIPLPHVDEQRRIIARIRKSLDRLEKIRELTEEQSKAENQVVRASRREFLGGPLAIPSGWKEKRLDELADVIYGISAAISNNKDPKIGPPIVRMANISIDGHLDLSDLRYCPIPKGKESHFALNPGDLLLNWRSGSAQHVGKTALFNETGLYTCASFILRIRSKEGISNNRYLRHVLNFMRSEGVFSGQSRMQINHKLNATEFSAFPIRIPSTIQEEEIIADRLDAIETFSNQIRKEISTKSHEVEELREAILRKAFTGEL